MLFDEETPPSPQPRLYLPSPLLTKEGKEKAEIVNELVNTYREGRAGPHDS